MNLLKQIFTWWNGQTIGTRFHTWRNGKKVGEDQFGNVYYQGGKDSEGRTRRWVIYNGYAEASAIPPGWHGWMHHRTDVSPADEDYKAREWEKNPANAGGPHHGSGTSRPRRQPAPAIRGTVSSIDDRPQARRHRQQAVGRQRIDHHPLREQRHADVAGRRR